MSELTDEFIFAVPKKLTDEEALAAIKEAQAAASKALEDLVIYGRAEVKKREPAFWEVPFNVTEEKPHE